jgi:tripartite-type tricarboxylate transporter receptor subunit TctC
MTSAATVMIAAGTFSTPSRAEFPDNPVAMMVMFRAGSAVDVTAPHLAEGIAKRLRVAVPPFCPRRISRR